LVAEDLFLVGHTPEAESGVRALDRGQVVAIGAEVRVHHTGLVPVDALDLPVVRNTDDADGPLLADTGLEAVPGVEGQSAGTRRPGVPGRQGADVRGGHGGDGLVAQPLVGANAGGLGRRVRAVQPLPRLAAEPAGTSLFVEREPQTGPGIALAELGRR